MRFEDIQQDLNALRGIAAGVENEKALACYDALLQLWLKMRSPQLGETPEPQFYSALMTHHLHQDSLLWSRVRALALIQAGAFGAAYALRYVDWIPLALWPMALALTAVLWGLAWKDAQDRAVNLVVMDKLATALIPADMRRILTNHGTADEPRYVGVTSHKRIPILKSGWTCLNVGLAVLIVFDVVMFLAFWLGRDALQAH